MPSIVLLPHLVKMNNCQASADINAVEGIQPFNSGV